MTTRYLVALVVMAVVVTSCATASVWLNGLDGVPVLEDYPTANVRVYRVGLRCRLEVNTPTATIITLPTRCVAVPHVVPSVTVPR